MSHDAGFFADAHRPRAKTSPGELLRAKETRRIYAAYQSIFGLVDGKLSDDGQIVLTDLITAANLGEMSGALSDSELREWYGRRKILLHIINRLDRDGTKAGQLTQQIRESLT